jgi:putative addiction module component (TIGR02574 family)
MARKVEEIERAIRSLSGDERRPLLRGLVDNFDGNSDPEVEKAWLEEAQRRLQGLQQGVVEAVSVEEVFENARDCLKNKRFLSRIGARRND